MKIYLGSISYRTMEVPHHTSLLKFHDLCHERGIEVVDGVVRGDALVERARSIAASSFLRSDCDVMLSIDSDIRFSPEQALRMCETAMEKDIVGGMYLTRNERRPQPALMLENDSPVVFADDAPLVEARYLSTGFIATTRKPFEAIIEDLPLCHQSWGESAFWPIYVPWVQEFEGEDKYILLSEDWAFCERAREKGFKLWLDPRVRLAHHGDYGYMLEDLLRQPRLEPQAIILERSADGMVNATGYGGLPQEILTLPDDVIQYFHIESVDEMRAALSSGTKALGDLWRGHTGSEKNFYRRDDVGKAYILDLANWHMQKPVVDMLSELEAYRERDFKVLDYGSGIGTSALILADGNRVDCVEPNPIMREFTQQRAGRLARELHFLNGQGPAKEEYDLAVCTHVLEHVPNPEQVALSVSDALKPGGLVFAESDFTDHGDHPMHHLDASDAVGAHYWDDLGLKRISQRWWQKEAPLVSS